MRLFHLLFTRHHGGLEQSYLDYTEMLQALGHEVTACVSPHAPYLEAVLGRASHVRVLDPRGFYDMLACWRLRHWLKTDAPDLLIAHNAKAIALARIASCGLSIPLLGVTHSYKTARTVKADALITLTPHMRDHFEQAGIPSSCLWVVPNMIAQPSTPFVPHPYRSPPVIGAIGRLSSEKGFADWLWALSLLEQQSIPFQAVLAGDGDERGSLEALAATLGLTDRLRFIGWVEDKAAFYRSIDVLCVPSHQESFGLVVLEAMAYGVPVLATRTSGPGTIINDARNGRLVAIGDYTALAETLRSMLAQPEETQAYAMQAHQTVQEYSKEKVMQALSKVLEDVISS